VARSALLILISLWANVASASPAATRTVIVFDNSGSMKKNDPGRLSDAAARLYFELARPGDEVALVAFDEKAKVMIPLGRRVNRDEVARALESLRFTGPTTNIGAALEAAAHVLGDETPAGRKDRVLLITDGQVDLGPARAEQVPGEVARISGPLAEQFRSRAAPVYTIAFTAEADRELLEKVAVKSGGLHRYIPSPSELHKAFTEMFVLAGDAESLPVEDGEVTIDESIGSAHMVLSKNHPDDHNKLVAPDEGEVSADHPRDGVEWTSAPSHDVVRLTRPQAGQWNIEQPEGVHGAVAIVGESDLQFVVRVGPTPATVQDPVHFEAELLEHGERVVAYARLKEVKVDGPDQGSERPQPGDRAPGRSKREGPLRRRESKTRWSVNTRWW
jgi:Mg-chelatase subunit ChlD